MPVKIFEGIGVGVLTVLVVLGLLFVRRAVIARGGGTIDMSLRLTTVVEGRGWSSGVGRFVGDELRWYRMFSFAFRPRRVLSRQSLVVDQRRAPDGPERLVLPADWAVVRCTVHQTAVEIAMAQTTLAGFLSWIEAAPPGAASTRLSHLP
jgi:hypothetical protein